MFKFEYYETANAAWICSTVLPFLDGNKGNALLYLPVQVAEIWQVVLQHSDPMVSSAAKLCLQKWRQVLVSVGK